MTSKLAELEAAWIEHSTEEDVYFELFKGNGPMGLRRSAKVTGALASLTFGRYQALDNKWIENDRAVWLGMIMSDRPGEGARFLDDLRRKVRRAGMVLIGSPTPLKPRDWPPDRHFDHRTEPLIGWYLRRGFRVVQNASETRVFAPRECRSVQIDFRLA